MKKCDNQSIDFKRVVRLERSDAWQKAITAALAVIDGMHGNEMYCQAWMKAGREVAKLLRLNPDDIKSI